MNHFSLRPICCVLCLSITLCACSGPPSQAGSVPSSTSESVSSQMSVQGNDGILDIGYSSTLDSLTPFRPEIMRDAPFMSQLCESLAVLDSEQQLQPWIATQWETQDNGFTYDVQIHEGISDSEGNSITAADIVWYIQTEKEKSLKPVFAKIESVTQTGDYSFQIKLSSNVVGTFEKIMTDSYAVSQAAYEASEDEFATTLVCSSPYVVTEFIPSSLLTLELRDDYWQDLDDLPECVRPQVSKICYHSIPEASQMGIALETGTIDMAIRIDSSTGDQFVDNPDYTVELSTGHQGWQLFFSGAEQSPVAQDVALRQAICYAIDADGLVTGLCAGYGTTMHDAHSSIMVGYDKDWDSQEYFPYDLEKAKELLAQSDYQGQTLSILAISSTFSQRLAQMVQSYLIAAGIQVELNIVDNALFTATRLDGTKYDMVLLTIGGIYLSDAWAIRYDPAAYPAGDATSRNDQILAELLYKTWTPDGYTKENINEVHEYLRDNAIAYGMVNPQNMCIWRNSIGLENEVREVAGYIAPAASTYTAFSLN